jgi:membrane associated rhomboid family serine protease
MGYQDREYFRESHSPYLNLIRSTRVCWGLVIVIALVFLATIFTQETTDPLQDYLRIDPTAMVQDWQWHRLLTAVFVADKAWHLAFALVLIWLIGHELEQMVGGLEFFAFFLVATILSNLVVTLVYYYLMPGHGMALFGAGVASFGPAGPALALLAWAVMLNPHRVATYLFVPMPLWIMGMLVMTFDLFFFMQHQPMAIRLAVHALSIPFACAYAIFDWRLTSWRRFSRRKSVQLQLSSVLQFPARRTNGHTEEQPPATTTSMIRRTVDEQLEAKLDAVLEKVSASGMQSLTEDEKSILKKASEVMKRRKS